MIAHAFAIISLLPMAMSGPFYGRNIKPALSNDPLDSRFVQKNIDGYGYGCKCGERKSNIGYGRIIGGDNIKNDGWMVLLYFEDAPRKYPCAGTIINNRYILTALHCVVKNASLPIKDLETFNTTTARVHIGGEIFNKKKRNKKKKNKNKKNKNKKNMNKKNKIKKNKNKMKENNKNKKRLDEILEVEEIVLNDAGADLALVKVKGMINTKVYPPICLPSKEPPYAVQNVRGMAAGWGRNEKQTKPGKYLKGLDVPITNDTERCTALKNQANEKNWFCFGEQGKSACFGDSGGPVMVQENANENRWTLAGIISGGTSAICGVGYGNGYGLAVDVYQWINWVTFYAEDGDYC